MPNLDRCIASAAFGLASAVFACSSPDASQPAAPSGASGTTGAAGSTGAATGAGGGSSVSAGGGAGQGDVPTGSGGGAGQGGRTPVGDPMDAALDAPVVASPDASDDNGDTKPVAPLKVTAPKQQIVRGNVGLDPRAPTMMGKLVIDLGVDSGSVLSWAIKRGFHSMGVTIFHCNVDQNPGPFDGDCRLNTFDGMPHGTQNNMTPTTCISGQVTAQLKLLQQMHAEEGWGYFLNADGTVRWSDVAITGMSHGATTAARIGRAVRLYRAVSRSGPRDNGCGLPGGVAKGPFDPQSPPWEANCTKFADWLGETSATPYDRFYGLVGTTDVEYGDIMFAMEHMKYPGSPVQWNVAGANFAGAHRFYSTEGGHLDWLQAAQRPINTDDVLNIAFGVPPENQHPTF